MKKIMILGTMITLFAFTQTACFAQSASFGVSGNLNNNSTTPFGVSGSLKNNAPAPIIKHTQSVDSKGVKTVGVYTTIIKKDCPSKGYITEETSGALENSKGVRTVTLETVVKKGNKVISHTSNQNSSKKK